MSSPSYTGLSSPASVFSLPLEVIEQVLVACASSGSPESIASFSQTCRIYSELIYGNADSHLWREVYLATFDDPRPQLNALGQPVENSDQDSKVDWRKEYQRRIRARKMFQSSTVDFHTLASNLRALSSTATSLIPRLPEAEDDISANITWMEEVFASGFPPALVRKLTLNKMHDHDSDLIATLPLSEQFIMDPDWERSAAGRELYKLFFLTGFRPSPSSTGNDEPEEGRYNLRNSTTKKKFIEEPEMSVTKQAALARTVARHRVYHLPYLSQERCWGPYLRANSPPLPVDDTDNELPTQPNGKGKGKERAVEEPEEPSPSKKTRRKPPKKKQDKPKEQDDPLLQDDSDHDGSDAIQVDMSFIRAILTNFYSAAHHHHHHHHAHDENDPLADAVEIDDDDDDEENDPDFIVAVDEDDDSSSEISFLSDSSQVDLLHDQDLFAPAQGPLPVYPSVPHLLYPDYAFLSAARLVVTENLRERYGNGSTDSQMPMWPWFTTASAVEATREILMRMGVTLPPRPSEQQTNSENHDDQENSASEGKSDSHSGNNENPVSSSSSAGVRGWESLRMGSAPGFWEGSGTREGWMGPQKQDEEIQSDQIPEKDKPEIPEPWLKESVEWVDGWDWAGAEGRWMRAVCWMDYRDLLFHNLQASYPLAARYHQEIQETCRVFPMTLRIVGYSRVPAPNALPPPSSTASPESPSSSKPKGKGKGKARDPAASPELGSYDPLVYALPVIHVVGEFRGSDVDESVARRARGTIRMIGDRAIRWNLISSEVSSPDRDEWVMEGIQVGGIGSAMGVVGMWTGASHERGDPIGPSLAWKME